MLINFGIEAGEDLIVCHTYKLSRVVVALGSPWAKKCQILISTRNSERVIF